MKRYRRDRRETENRVKVLDWRDGDRNSSQRDRVREVERWRDKETEGRCKREIEAEPRCSEIQIYRRQRDRQ